MNALCAIGQHDLTEPLTVMGGLGDQPVPVYRARCCKRGCGYREPVTEEDASAMQVLHEKFDAIAAQYRKR